MNHIAYFKGKSYLFPKTLPVYYKKKAWSQPVLISNTSYGSVTCSEAGSSHPAWNAFDGDTSTWWEVNKVTTGWLMWKLPMKIYVTGITITAGHSDRPKTTVQVYADEEKTIQIGSSITSTAIEPKPIEDIPVDGVYTDTLYFDMSSPETYPGISEIVITAHTLSPTGTKDDYDKVIEELRYCVSCTE